jgi:stage II sporulation protein AA (anti-sigma F factor antagonist)
MGDLVPGAGATTGVEIDDRAHTAVVTLHGELDLDNVEALMHDLGPVLRRDDLPTVVFDLADLTFMDSSGISALVRTVGAGKTVRLRHPTPIIRELLTLMGLDDVLREDG